MKASIAVAAVVVSCTIGGCAIATHSADPKPIAATAISTSANRPAPTGPATALAQWRNRSEPAVAAMQDSMRDLAIAMRSTDYPAIQTSCRRVDDAARAIGSALPSPDSGLTAAVAAAVNSFTTATQGCGIWAPGVTDDQANAFTASMRTAIDQMDAAMLMMSGPPYPN